MNYWAEIETKTDRIKKLEKQVNSNTSSYICVVDNNTTEKFFN